MISVEVIINDCELRRTVKMKVKFKFLKKTCNFSYIFAMKQAKRITFKSLIKT